MPHPETAYLKPALLFLLCAYIYVAVAIPGPEERARTRHDFFRVYCSSMDTLYVNHLDSAALWNLPLDQRALTSWHYRLKKHWNILDPQSLKELPGMDTSFVYCAAGLLDYTPWRTAPNPRPYAAQGYSASSSSSPVTYTPRLSKRYTPVEINSGDSLDLLALPGIGPWTAHQFLRERRRWGYLVDIGQLKDLGQLRGRWEPMWDSLLYVVPGKPALSLNRSPKDSLYRFRPLSLSQVKRIVFYREGFGHVSWDACREWEEFLGVDVELLQKYIEE